MRLLLILLACVICCLFFFNRKSAPDPLVIADGIEIYAVIPPEHMEAAGGDKVLIAPAGSLRRLRIMRDADNHMEIWLGFPNEESAQIGNVMLKWRVTDWVLQPPGQNGIPFRFAPGILSGDCVLCITGYGEARMQKILASMQKPIK